ncbi:unnamed protein product [Mytilus edulis]|uniref:Uncharacterized protein n=1 Tax=Mytilus edulis TaxID=6550 RepID=A0A8S3QT17_MYTED|nr:unnamed protein product [Mytilus edulis]
MVTRSMSKRKHSGSVNDNANTKKLKVDLQNEHTTDNIKVKIEKELWQSENYVSPENKEGNVRPTHLEITESYIANLKDDDAFDSDEDNEQKPNLSFTKIEQNDISCEKRYDIVINTVCETVSESQTTSQNSYKSSTTGIDTLYSRISTFPSPETIKREKQPKTFPKLYRLLGELENKDNGLRAKNPLSSITVAEHVAYGSTGVKSKYISTYVAIIDLTKENIRKEYELRNNDNINEKFHKFAASHGEVLLEGYIPTDCIEHA